MITNPEILHGMTKEQLIQHVTEVEDVLKMCRATIAHQQQTIETLQSQAKLYYKVATDYVPPPENEYDGFCGF